MNANRDQGIVAGLKRTLSAQRNVHIVYIAILAKNLSQMIFRDILCQSLHDNLFVRLMICAPRVLIGGDAPLCFLTGFRFGSGCGHDSGCAPCCLRASSFGCDYRESGHYDGEATVSPWMANDDAKRIETWSWNASRMIVSDCGNVSLDEVWKEKAFSALVHKGTAD